MPTPSSPATLPAPRIAEAEHIRTAIANHLATLQSSPTISSALATEILTVLSGTQFITDVLRAERFILQTLEWRSQANRLISRDFVLAMMGHMFLGIMGSRIARQQHGQIAGLRKQVERGPQERTCHDLRVLLQQMDATLARVAQAALEQRAQAQMHGITPDGILAAAAHWHFAEKQRRRADAWKWRYPMYVVMQTLDERSVEAATEMLQFGAGDLLVTINDHPAVATILVNNATLTIPYHFRGKWRSYVPDAVVTLANPSKPSVNFFDEEAEERAAKALVERMLSPEPVAVEDEQASDLRSEVFVVVEVRRARDVRDQAQSEAAEHWCAALSADGSYGQWHYVCCETVEELPAHLTALAALYD
jgi:hypothetical protein